jgi:hypothetical protein
MEAENKLEWTEKARDTLGQVRDQAGSWDERVRTFAREKPLMAVLCAVVGGYAIARVSTWR